MPITLNHSNISVRYNTGSNYIIETVKSDLYVRDSRTGISSNLTAEPVVIFPTTLTKVQSFTHSGGTEAQTSYTFNFPVKTLCDILIVGGGGSGDRQIGGGGGGGAVLYASGVEIPADTYTIKVGKGGENGNGGNSEAFGATCLGGGSTTFVGWGTPNNGTAGGSGSGSSPGGDPNATGGTVGASTKGTLLSSGTLYNGNVGGNALKQTQSSTGAVCGGGGGGAGTAGFNSSSTQYTTRSSWLAAGSPSKGGDGIPINITGTTYYWGAGGGGGSVITHAGDGGLGGGGGGGHGMSSSIVYPAGLAGTGGINSGGNGLNTGTENGGNGGAGTGSGGGGGGYNANSATYNAGNGGSGIVIIRYVAFGIPEGNPITHKTLNFAYTVAQPTYTLNFPVPTTTDILERTAGRSILNNSNLILQGTYDINLTASSAQIIPRTGQYLPFTSTSNLSQNIAFRYHLLNPIKMPEGAQWTYNSSNANVYHMGSVGIGTTNPNYNLDVSGTIFTSTGGYTQTGLTTWTVMSDRRIKDNIVEASYDKCLENVKNVDLYSFNFKDNCVNTNDKNQLGFIAQEVQQVYPKAVEVGRMILNTNETINDVLTLNTTQIDYTLYGAVKELINKVEILETKINM